MPDVHIWIRKEDLKTWRAIKNKPEWLHTALNAQKPASSPLRGSHGYIPTITETGRAGDWVDNLQNQKGKP